MTDERAFLRAIYDAPADPSPYLVLADWLEERGDPRGELLRQLADVNQEWGEAGPLRWRIHVEPTGRGEWRRCCWRVSICGHGRKRAAYSLLLSRRPSVVARARSRVARAVLSPWADQALAAGAGPWPAHRPQKFLPSDGQCIDGVTFHDVTYGGGVWEDLLQSAGGRDYTAADWPKLDLSNQPEERTKKDRPSR
jgi:uncharacterized protein (TIGR02996 family)